MELVGTNELARLTGLAGKTVTARLKAAGLVPTPGPRRARLFPSDQALSILLCGVERLDAGQEKARFDKVRRERQELALARDRRDLVPADDVVRWWWDLLIPVKQALLGLPHRLAVAVAATETDRLAAQQAADQVVRELLTGLATARAVPPEHHEDGDDGHAPDRPADRRHARRGGKNLGAAKPRRRAAQSG